VHALLAVAMIAAFAWPDSATAGDWPHLRGPRYDAVSDEIGLASSWPDVGPPILWSRDLGQGFSGFVVAENRAFTQFQSVTTGQCVICLDAQAGTTIWQRRIDAPWQSGGAYPAATGDSVWSRNVVQEFHARGIGFGYACTPLVEEGKVFLPVGGVGASVVALDAGNGSVVWKSSDDPASYCPAFPITVDGKRQIVAYLQNCLIGLDAETGRQVWRESLSSDYDEHSAWPTYAEPDLLISAPFRGGLRAFSARPDGSFAPKWISTELSNDVASSVRVGDYLYGFDLTELQARIYRPSRGRFVCVNARTGKLCWSTVRTGHATALAADGKLFLLNDTGTLILAKASADGYHELSRCRILEGGHCWTPPSLSNGKLFARDGERAICVWVGETSAIPPSVHHQSAGTHWHFDWTRLLGREPEYPNDAPSVEELRRWFDACGVAVFLPSALLAVVSCAVSKPGWRRRVVQGTFWLSAFTLGVVATPLLSTSREAFICTWPASLYAALAITLRAAVHADRSGNRSRATWQSRGVVLLFLMVVLAYYLLCKKVGLMTLWAFIPGFVPALLFAVPAAKARWIAVALLVDACGFSAYFWLSGLGIGWRAMLR
jgi:outer membrane protein assembly factor BamB